MGLLIKGATIVIDEAHNLEAVAEDTLTYKLPLTSLKYTNIGKKGNKNV